MATIKDQPFPNSNEIHKFCVFKTSIFLKYHKNPINKEARVSNSNLWKYKNCVGRITRVGPKNTQTWPSQIAIYKKANPRVISPRSRDVGKGNILHGLTPTFMQRVWFEQLNPWHQTTQQTNLLLSQTDPFLKKIR